jgi:predicted PurR-regulated permease PerM
MAGSTRAEHPRQAEEREGDLVTRPVRIAAAWAWRWIIIVLACVPIFWLLAKTTFIVVPLVVGVLLTALLVPLTNYLRNQLRWPKGFALLAALVALFGAIAILVGLVVQAFRSGERIDFTLIEERYQELMVWAENSPLHLSEDQLISWFQGMSTWLETNVGTLIETTLTAGSTLGSIATGFAFALFALIFYLLDGRRIWLFVVSLFPRAARAAVDGAGERAWITVGHYVRVQVVVALIDAVGIFIGAVVLQVPFALAIGIIVFLFAFVPLIGAFLSGAVAVVLALLSHGLWTAVIMLVIVVAVMAIESNVLQPLIMGQAVQIHPLAILVSVSAGSIFAGVAGAVVAVPIVAATNVMVRYIASGKWRDEPDPTEGMVMQLDTNAAKVPKRRPIKIRVRKKATPGE